MNQAKKFTWEKIGSRLRQAREEKKLTQQELANRMGQRLTRESGEDVKIPASMIRQWERGKFPGALSRFWALCQELGCSTDQVLGETAVGEGCGLRWKWQFPDPAQSDRGRIQKGIDLFHQIVSGGEPSDVDGNGNELLLKQALYTAHIQLLGVRRDEERENRLRQKYGSLKYCFVAGLDGLPSSRVVDSTIRAEAVARLAVDEWLKILNEARPALPRSIGITGGTVMARFVELLPFAHPLLSKMEWLSLLATKEYLRVALAGTSANNLIGRLLYRQPLAVGFGLPFVNLDRREMRPNRAEERWELNYARDILSRARKVDVAFVTVGTREVDYLREQALLGLVSLATIFEEMSEQEQENCVGDVLLRLLDRDGKEIGGERIKEDIRKLVYSIELDDLRQIAQRGEVFVLCERAEKSNVIAALVNRGLVNALVIDSATADRLLAQS
ncbi:MAG: sugar-binding domain-containing protein [Anaerolineae bacterium]